MDTLTTIRTFVSVADAGSFTAAAHSLNITPQLASKYVRQLESRLGMRLLNRTTRQVALTQSGGAYLVPARNLIDQFDEMESLAQDEQAELSGKVRITAPTGFGLLMVTPALAVFQEQHPAIELDLILTDRRVSLIEEGIDLAIRVGRSEDSSLTMKKLMDMPNVVCASPDYLERTGVPQHPRALATHNCLVNSGLVEPGVWRFRENGRDFAVKVSGAVRINQPRALAELAIMGKGLACLPLYAARQGLVSGALVEVLDRFAPAPSAAIALYPSKRFLAPRVRAVIDHLSDWVSQ